MTATVGLPAYHRAARLDAELGDPYDPDNPYGFAAMVSRDTVEGFPIALAARLGPRLALSFVPAEHGGELSTVDEALTTIRVVARRDVTVMPATMFSITAASCVLLAGSDAQRRSVVELLKAGKAIGFALSEPDHGSDLLANECALVSDDFDGYGWRLDGEKWLVGLGERCQALLVVAHSGGRGPAAFSAVLLDGEALRDARGAALFASDKDAAGANLAWQRTTGMRGIDFGGFRFVDTPVRADAMVGERGRGMETAMKAMQYVRVMSTAANLACADTGLRLALDFAVRHRVAGRAVAEHPAPRRELATAATMLVAADAVALTTARAVHTLPAQANLTSSVTKLVCTDGTEELLGRCADVLASRSVLRDGPSAAFEVVRRDNTMVRFVDTSPVANLRLVAMQLPQWAQGYDPRPDGFAASDGLVAAYDLDAELPPLRLAALELSCRGRDDVTAALPLVAAGVRDALAHNDRAVPRIAALETAVDGLRREVLRLKERPGSSVELLDLAERFCWLHAAASCVHLWWFNRGRELYGEEPRGTGWLTAVLSLLIDRAHGGTARCDAADTEAAFALAARLHRHGRLFSAVELPLAGGARGDDRRELR